MELVEQRNMKVATACRLFGHCRQAFYQSKADIEAEVNRDKIILDNVREIRDEDPGIGGYKLWLMLTELYGRELIPGRDSFFTLLRRHQLMLPPRKARHTTNSNHRYHKWKNLVKDIVLTSANQLWVSDITYIQLANGDVAYLHLVTDAYSRKIVGWVLADTLRAALYIAQIVAIGLGTCCPSREQRLPVSCSPAPHHVFPEGSLDGHGRNAVSIFKEKSM